MASDLIINGVLVDRPGSHLTLGSLELSVDEPDRLTMTELCVAGGPGSWSAGNPCVLEVDGTAYFRGQFVSAHPANIGTGPITVSYQALGVRWLCNDIFITAQDGTGTLEFNLTPNDPDYVFGDTSLELGAILTQLFNLHLAELAAVGIDAVPPYDPAELAALTVTPPEAVYLSGRLIDSAADLVATWAPKFALYPCAADGKIHVVNTLTLPATTLTLDLDPITLDSVSKTHQECYTAVKARGAADVQAAYLTYLLGTLAAGWTMAAQLVWTIQDFLNPKGAADGGVITGMTSTTLTIQSDDAAVHWILDYWQPLDAYVIAFDPLAGSIGFSEQKRITSNTALIAGGTSVLTLDSPFDNSGYTHYQIRGRRTAASLVWRKLVIVPTWIAQHLARHFQRSMPFSPVEGEVVQVVSPQCLVCFGAGGPPWTEEPMPMELVLFDGSACTTQATVSATISGGAVTGFTGLTPGAGYEPSQASIGVSIYGGGGIGATAHAISDAGGFIVSVVLDAGGSGYTTPPFVAIGVSNGYLVTNNPICTYYATPAQLAAGGSAIPPPGDIKVLIPYSRGALSVTAPASGFEGTAYTVDGIERTLVIDYPQWQDKGDTARMALLAQEKLDSQKDTVIEGQLTIWDKDTSWLTLVRALNIARDGGTTGWEAIAAPVRGVTLEYQDRSKEWLTRLRFSTRRRPFTGDRLYTPVPYGRGPGFGGGTLNTAAATARAMAGLQAFGSDLDSVAGNAGGSFGEMGDKAGGAFGTVSDAAHSMAGQGEGGEDGGDQFGLVPGGTGQVAKKFTGRKQADDKGNTIAAANKVIQEEDRMRRKEEQQERRGAQHNRAIDRELDKEVDQQIRDAPGKGFVDVPPTAPGGG
jgi:hypothetical protein